MGSREAVEHVDLRKERTWELLTLVELARIHLSKQRQSE